jgi:protein-tyrosine phosphatase
VIDLHCHILPALDDGALDLDDAVAIAWQAQSDGIRTVCATPHIRHDHDVVVGELADRVAELGAELWRRGIPVHVTIGGGRRGRGDGSARP